MTVQRVATYRVQFRNGMTLDAAADVVPYLKRLGISHLYASPIFTATSGSTHGYDITDYDEIEPAIGGRRGLERLVEALRRHRMGLLLDIVPNHMAASLENRWWHDVVEHGSQSRFARHFDIDWSRKLTLPILGRDYEEALRAGELTLARDPVTGGLALSYFDQAFPLKPASYASIAARLSGDQAAQVAELARRRSAGTDAAGATSEARVEKEDLTPVLAGLSQDKAFVDDLVRRQPWRLTFWQEARRDLSYRRFFEVTGLVGVRVEDRVVFDDVHRLVLSLVRDGLVDGLRVDHVDGLAAPTAYLKRLRAEVGPDTWLLVEKILGQGERLPDEWRRIGVGTTGYEFIPALASLMVTPAGEASLRAVHHGFTGFRGDEEELRTAKRLILRRNFEGEFGALAREAADLAGQQADGPRPDAIDRALTELILAFPVYRTYVEAEGPTVVDHAMLAGAASRAAAAGADRLALQFLLDLILSGKAADAEPVHAFTTRFQQLTGPVMAKAVEDTFFYRANALIALNEVGATPVAPTLGVAEFHRFMADRAGERDNLLATSTHDTKRGEDARARLFAIAADPQRWIDAVERWAALNAPLRPAGEAHDPQAEWLFYQALAGVWPVEEQPDETGLADLRDRIQDFARKALREAKLRTDWLAVDEEYERSVLDFVAGALDPRNRAFLDDFARSIEPLIEAGIVNSLAQTLAKLTGPGIPDIYQGSEHADFSLVDPDNRREVPFADHARGLEGAPAALDADASLSFGRLKQNLTAQVLAFRAEHAGLFAAGTYVPLKVRGAGNDGIVAYLREYGDHAVLVVLRRAVSPSVAAGDLSACEIALPARFEFAEFHDVLSDRRFRCGTSVPLSLLLDRLPVALCSAMIVD